VDLLLCTTVIESGIDIGTANTIIVDDAHRYGLSQLYQLRGRVGRRHLKGFAYFLYPPNVSKEALERLKIVKSHTGPGSGLEIALRDLEMRGYGAVLGIDQSGHVESIGYKYYVELMKEAVWKFKGEEVEEGDVEIIGYPGDVHIPDWYVQNPMERLRLYRKISSAKNFEEIEEIGSEMKDRFGKIPEPVSNLLRLAKFRLALMKMGVEKVEIGKDSVTLWLRKRVDLSNFNHVFLKENVLVIVERFEKFEEEILKNPPTGGG